MATVNGAIAAQFAPEVGTLERGKRADLIAISLKRTSLPYLDPDMPLLEALLARVHGSDVRLTMVDGRILYRDGRFLELDLDEIEQAAVSTARLARRPKDPANRHRTVDLQDLLRRHYEGVTASRVRGNSD